MWLRRREEIESVPDFPEIPPDEYLPTVVDLATQDSIIGAIEAPLRGIYLALRLGVRPGEARALEVQDYRDHRLLISKAAKGSRADAPVRGTKTRRVRVVPVDSELAEWIGNYRCGVIGTAPLFVNRRGGRSPESTLRHVWEAATKRVGVQVGLYEGTKHSRAQQRPVDAACRSITSRRCSATATHAARSATSASHRSQP